MPTFFPPKCTMPIHFGKSRYELGSFTNVHTGEIYVYIVVAHCMAMAGVLSYLLGCLVTTTYVKILVLYLIRKDLYTTVPVVTLGAKYNTQVGKKIEEREVCERQSLSSHPQCLLLIGPNRPI